MNEPSEATIRQAIGTAITDAFTRAGAINDHEARIAFAVHSAVSKALDGLFTRAKETQQ
ncbi:hypothetical protein HZY97_16065 [Sphingomonas sp. R-74633]|uniref:hypothetical protein n=1 Tax=Sphingomonas sp. R-74633 TaxID=2751188 RepID=UPI0015D3CDEF|nr:hypothetical protein [Sphingomonas sp. R-74633]NYT42288.1 hypothetical protein [Sphingomonas sp. R-74633]